MPLDEGRLQGELVRRQAHGLFGELDTNTLHLEEDLSRANDSDPVIRGSLALTHSGLRGLLGDRLIGKQSQPDLATTLDETRHGYPARFDLSIRDVPTFHDLQAKITERQIGAAPSLTTHATALLLAVLDLLWHQHRETLYKAIYSSLSRPGRERPDRNGLLPMELKSTGCADWLTTLLLLVDVAAVDPRFNTDDTVGRVRFREAVVDIGTKRVQWKPALQIPL